MSCSKAASIGGLGSASSRKPSSSVPASVFALLTIASCDSTRSAARSTLSTCRTGEIAEGAALFRPTLLQNRCGKCRAEKHRGCEELTIGWISAVRPSRQPLRGFLRMRTILNAINDTPHAEERPEGASRSTHNIDAARPSLLRQYSHKLIAHSAGLWLAERRQHGRQH